MFDHGCKRLYCNDMKKMFLEKFCKISQNFLQYSTFPDDPELPEGVKEYGSSSDDPEARNLFLGSELLRTFAPLLFACCARPCAFGIDSSEAIII